MTSHLGVQLHVANAASGRPRVVVPSGTLCVDALPLQRDAGLPPHLQGSGLRRPRAGTLRWRGLRLCGHLRPLEMPPVCLRGQAEMLLISLPSQQLLDGAHELAATH